MRGEHIGNPPSISNVVAKDGAMKWVSTSWPSLIIKEMSKGEMGEWQVHNILTQLPEEYTLFDDVVLKTSWHQFVQNSFSAMTKRSMSQIVT